MADPAIAAVTRPDPILTDTPQNPCQAGADYVAGVDASGNPVVPADVGAAKVPLPAQVAVPLPNHHRGQDSGYIVLDGRQVGQLVNPKPCN